MTAAMTTVNVPREMIDGLSALERDLIKCFNPRSEWGLFTYLFFYGFEDELEGAYPNEVMKAGVRLLAAKGVLQFKRGLRNEEGGVAGSGYGLTDLGREVYATLAAAPKAEPVSDPDELAACEMNRQSDFEAMTVIADFLRDNPADPYSGRQCEEHVLFARDALYAHPNPNRPGAQDSFTPKSIRRAHL